MGVCPAFVVHREVGVGHAVGRGGFDEDFRRAEDHGDPVLVVAQLDGLPLPHVGEPRRFGEGHAVPADFGDPQTGLHVPHHSVRHGVTVAAQHPRPHGPHQAHGRRPREAASVNVREVRVHQQQPVAVVALDDGGVRVHDQ